MMPLLILCVIFVSGCKDGASTNTSITIPNINDYTILFIQGVDENGAASSSTSKTIDDAEEIQDFINKVNNMEVVEPSKGELSQKSKALNKPGNYIFALSQIKKPVDQSIYFMNFFEDGSIQFQQEDKNEMNYLSKEKHPEILEELKKSLDINF